MQERAIAAVETRPRQRRRGANFLLNPSLQLRLPLYLLLITAVFGVLQIGHGYLAYERLYYAIIQQAGKASYLLQLLRGQTADFLFVSTLILTAYTMAILGASVAYAHRMVGPTVAFRRHLEALKNGDYSARAQLRKGDAFTEIADDLNALAERLQAEARPRP